MGFAVQQNPLAVVVSSPAGVAVLAQYSVEFALHFAVVAVPQCSAAAAVVGRG